MLVVGLWTSSVLCLLLGWAQTCAVRVTLIRKEPVSLQSVVEVSWFSMCRFLTEKSSRESDETTEMCSLEAIFEQIICCVCLNQRTVFDQDSSHCVALSRLTAGVKSSNYKIRNLKMSSVCVWFIPMLIYVQCSETKCFSLLSGICGFGICPLGSVCVYAKTKWLICDDLFACECIHLNLIILSFLLPPSCCKQYCYVN